MKANILAMFEDELKNGEKIVWCGQPFRGLLLRKADLFLIPISLLVGGFVFLWGFFSFTSCSSSFVILFDLIGLYLILGRFFVDIAIRRKTFYALTNKRVIFISGLFNQTVESLDLAELSDINLSENKGGKGTIIFGPMDSMSWRVYTGKSWPIRRFKVLQSPIFEMIDDVRMVYDLIKRNQKIS